MTVSTRRDQTLMTPTFTSRRVIFTALILLALNTSAFSQTLTADPVSIDFVSKYDNLEFEPSAVESIKESVPKFKTIQVWELMSAFADVPNFNVEGLTVREQSGTQQLIIGLRQPNRVRVYAIDLSRFNQSLKPEDKLCLFYFDAPKISNIPSELTSIEYLSGWKGFLILTTAEGPTSSTVPSQGSYLWFVEDAKIPKPASTSAKQQPSCDNPPVKPSEPLLLSFKNSTERKAEGLCVLSEDTTSHPARIAIVFDNDLYRTGSITPSGLQFLSITYTPK